ncbi:Uracil-DNA glycosylase [Amphibalanus amphitrite]|uniref:Uracil-DNA glycosylase n=1 Tax=Amphibalanus amphitrite TaxID=1232801 RepID=A0A6A4VAL4_AMPAM|nr:Uracil-DNA glycosylase [Amphibalanus amphitrite]
MATQQSIVIFFKRKNDGAPLRESNKKPHVDSTPQKKTAPVSPSASKGMSPGSPAALRSELLKLCAVHKVLHPSMALGWYKALKTEFDKPYFKKLSEFVTAQRRQHTVFPRAEHVFSWAAGDVNDVKVVILGQDPYHGPGQAHGEDPHHGPGQAHGEDPYHGPGQAHGEDPYHGPGQAHGEDPYHGPGQAHGEDPYHGPGQAHGEDPHHGPGQAHGEDPYHGPGQAHGEDPYHGPGQAHGEDPYHGPGQAHGEDPYHGPGQAHGEDPYHGPGQAHGEDPYHGPGQAHGEDPYHGPGQAHGEDPYHGPGQAHGLCFSVQRGVAPPPSLVNMYKELESDVEGFRHPGHGCLLGWARQGVLLLNACLTVRSGQPNSHKDQGWEQFTDAVIKHISSNQKHVVFMLWGSYAQKKGSVVDKSRHHVLTSTHPSPLSAHRGFLGCKHFSKCNQLLIQNNRTPIDWNDLPPE